MRMRMLALTWLLAMASLASAQHAGHVPAAVSRADLGSSAAFADDGALWAVGKQGEHVVWRVSRDFGASWSQPALVNVDPEPVAADGDSRPKIVVGKSGQLFVTWTRPLALPYTGEVRFARSLDAGKHWSAPVTVHADRQQITHRFDAMAVDRQGKLFIAWIDKRDQALAKAAGTPYHGAAIYFAVSDDDGASFRGDFKLAEHSCECCRIALLARPDTGVTALWRHVFAPNIRDHAIADLNADGSAGAIRRATFDDWAIDACPHHGPSLARDSDGTLHAVWFHLGKTTPGVSYGRLRNGAIEGQRVLGGNGAAHADIAIDGRRLLLVWKDFDGQRTWLRALRSDDAGEQWLELTLADTGDMSDQPRALMHNGRFHVFWNTRERPWQVVAVP